MRIAVMGTGGFGGYFGGLLARAGHEVTFVARGAHLAAIQQHGLRVESTLDGTFTVPGRALADTTALQAALFAEMKGRIKEDDSTVPAVGAAWVGA